MNLLVKNGDDQIPLIIYSHDLTMSRLLIHLGADPKRKTKSQYTALMAAVNHGDYDQVVFLSEQGLDIADSTEYGFSVIHYAIGNTNSRTLKWLLEKGADPNARTEEGITPLMDSLLYYDLDEIELLLEHGADVSLKDSEGRDILFYLEKRKSYQDELLYQRARDLIMNELIKALLKKSEPGEMSNG
jgi:ankyrin repeat protein